MDNQNEWRRFKPLTDDPVKLRHIDKLIREIGKENVVFLLKYLQLNHEIFQSSLKPP